VLPMQNDAAAADVSPGLQDAILAWLIGLDSIDILSQAAVASRPDNPFPYFYYEFGARWLIESEARATDSVLTIRVALVDAQTGIVLVQETVRQPRGQAPDPMTVERLLADVASYIRTE
jgi:TolB-like protein